MYYFFSSLFNVIHTVTFQISFTLIIQSVLAIGYVERFSKFFSCVYVFFPSYWLTNKVPIKRPSTGLLMYTLATRFCDEIHLYGFWPFPKDRSILPVFHCLKQFNIFYILVYLLMVRGQIQILVISLRPKSNNLSYFYLLLLFIIQQKQEDRGNFSSSPFIGEVMKALSPDLRQPIFLRIVVPTRNHIIMFNRLALYFSSKKNFLVKLLKLSIQKGKWRVVKNSTVFIPAIMVGNSYLALKKVKEAKC